MHKREVLGAKAKYPYIKTSVENGQKVRVVVTKMFTYFIRCSLFILCFKYTLIVFEKLNSGA